MRRIWLNGEIGCVPRRDEACRSPRRGARRGSRPSSSCGCPAGCRARGAAAPRRTASVRGGRSRAGRTRGPARGTARLRRGRPPSTTTMPTAGWPRAGSGTNSSGGAVMKARPLPKSSGASATRSRYIRATSPPMKPGHASNPPSSSGPISCRRRWNAVTMPKLPPPPRRPQNSSGFSSADAITLRPSAVTTSAFTRLSQVKPELALEPAAAAAEREAGDAGVGNAPTGDRETVLLGRGVELAPVEPGLGACHARVGVDLDALHRRACRTRRRRRPPPRRSPSGRRRRRTTAVP